jgi:hypothetical protein
MTLEQEVTPLTEVELPYHQDLPFPFFPALSSSSLCDYSSKCPCTISMYSFVKVIIFSSFLNVDYLFVN